MGKEILLPGCPNVAERALLPVPVEQINVAVDCVVDSIGGKGVDGIRALVIGRKVRLPHPVCMDHFASA